VQLTAARKNAAESLDAERAACEQHRGAIAELAEEALAAKVCNLHRKLPAMPGLACSATVPHA
jgi:hypothetical protein